MSVSKRHAKRRAVLARRKALAWRRANRHLERQPSPVRMAAILETLKRTWPDDAVPDFPHRKKGAA